MKHFIQGTSWEEAYSWIDMMIRNCNPNLVTSIHGKVRQNTAKEHHCASLQCDRELRERTVLKGKDGHSFGLSELELSKRPSIHKTVENKSYISVPMLTEASLTAALRRKQHKCLSRQMNNKKGTHAQYTSIHSWKWRKFSYIKIWKHSENIRHIWVKYATYKMTNMYVWFHLCEVQ